MLKVIMIGHLGRDPELKYTQGGDPICSFSIASTERKKDRATGENVEFTTWARVTFMGRMAETASQWLVKGKQVYIEGRGRLEEWTDRDGKVRTTLEIFGTEMQFIGPREGGSGGQGGGNRPAANSPRGAARERAKATTPAGGGLSLDDDSGGGEPDNNIPF